MSSSCSHTSTSVGDHQSCSCALQSSGVSQSLQEMEFERGIWSAAMDGNEEKVRKLLSSRVHPSTADSAGYTALHYACRSGHKGVCQLLLSSGAGVNIQTPGGVTPLHRAAYCGHLEVVRMLIEYAVDVSLTDSDGRTALHMAAERDHYEVAELLVSTAVSLVNVKDNRGQQPRDLLKNIDSKWKQLLSKGPS